MRTLVILLIVASHLVLAQGYSIADLEVLDQQNRFQEFFNHIYDPKPTTRGKAWRELYISMLDKFFQRLNEASDIKLDQWRLFEKLAQEKIIQSDEFLVQKRNTTLLKYIKTFEDPKVRLNKATDLFKNLGSPKELGVLFAAEFKASVDGYIFLKPMAQDSFGEFYCGKGAHYELLKLKIKNEFAYKKISLHRDCQAAFIKTLKKEMDSKILVSDFWKLEYLHRKKSLSAKEKANYHLSKMLNARSFDDINWKDSLSVLKNLKKNQKLREEILDIIKRHDPLPDKIFMAAEKRDRKIAFLRMLRDHYPEYIDYYSKECLAYYKGSKNFPSGNPTPYCKAYFKNALSAKSSPPGVVDQFYKIINAWRN